MYRIGIQLRDVALQFRAISLKDLLQQLTGELFALIVSDDGNLDFLLMAEILVITHLARHEGIGSAADGFTKTERSGTAAKSYLTDGTLQQFIGHHTFHIKRALQHLNKIAGSHRF